MFWQHVNNPVIRCDAASRSLTHTWLLRLWELAKDSLITVVPPAGFPILCCLIVGFPFGLFFCQSALVSRQHTQRLSSICTAFRALFTIFHLSDLSSDWRYKTIWTLCWKCSLPHSTEIESYCKPNNQPSSQSLSLSLSSCLFSHCLLSLSYTKLCTHTWMINF